MKQTSILQLAAVAVVAAIGGKLFSWLFTSRGEAVPIGGYPAGVMLLALAALVLFLGLKVKRYLDESKERSAAEIKTARKYQLDMVQAFRTILLAKAGAYCGAIFTGLLTGQLLHLFVAGGTLWGAIVPVAFGIISALTLAICGYLVESWGKTPPQEPLEEAETVSN